MLVSLPEFWLYGFELFQSGKPAIFVSNKFNMKLKKILPKCLISQNKF